MTTVPVVAVGDRTVGEGAPVLVIAEIGVNHDGEVAVALELVDAVAEAGADALKLQSFHPDEIATAQAEMASYQRQHEPEAASQSEMLARLSLTADEHAAVAKRCRERNIMFLSTPFDLASARMLLGLGVPAFKVGSGELTNLPLLEGLAQHRLPLLVSTGMADLAEVRAAVETIRASGALLVLLHCTSSYPAPESEANLRAIDTLRKAFGVPVGYSDHTEAFEVSLAAVACGACVLERHLTLSRDRVGPDHAMSLEPDGLASLVERVRKLERILGDGQKVAQPSEQELRRVARRSIVAARPLSAGEVLEPGCLAVKRPAGGLEPARLASLVGRRLARPLATDQQVSEADLEPLEDPVPGSGQ